MNTPIAHAPCRPLPARVVRSRTPDRLTAAPSRGFDRLLQVARRPARVRRFRRRRRRVAAPSGAAAVARARFETRISTCWSSTMTRSRRWGSTPRSPRGQQRLPSKRKQWTTGRCASRASWRCIAKQSVVDDGRAAYGARASPRLFRALQEEGDALAVGDWVLASVARNGQCWITYRVPPLSAITRRDGDGRSHGSSATSTRPRS